MCARVAPSRHTQKAQKPFHSLQPFKQKGDFVTLRIAAQLYFLRLPSTAMFWAVLLKNYTVVKGKSVVVLALPE